MTNLGNIKIEGAKLIFKNFSGIEKEYNREGDRNFGLLLDEELAEQLKDDGWNVKSFSPKDDPEEVIYYLPVKVKFGKIPPVAVLVSSRGKTRLDEETIGQLDWAIAETVDVIVRPYNYPEFAGRPSGISAYLKSIFFTIREDDLDLKYADLPYIEE